MALGSHVVRRKSRFWFRLRVPNELRHIVGGKRELLRSLRTSNALEARQRALALEVLAQTLFEAARSPMLDAKLVKELLRRFYETALAKDEIKRVTRAPLDEGTLPALQSARSWQAARLNEVVSLARIDVVKSKADTLLGEAGLELDPSGQDYRLFCLYVLRVFREIHKRVSERDRGEFGGTPTDPLLCSPLAPTQAPIGPSSPLGLRPGLTIREAYERYLAERTDFGTKTRVDHEATCRLLEEILGPTRKLGSVARADLVAFKDKLLKLPVNYTKRFKGMTAPEAIAANDARGLPTLNGKTINGKYLTCARSFLAWAKDNDHLDHNPASNIKVAGVKKRRANKDRDPFDATELQRIFAAPLFTGCRSASAIYEPGSVRIRDHYFWLPLLALWTGARLNELAQLTPGDVCKIDGVDCVDINDKGAKLVKTGSSIRSVPIHPELMRLGFLEFATAAKSAGQAKLFPGLKPSADGYESSPFSKFFSRFLVKVGVKTQRNSFHAFRHTFTDATRRAHLPDSLRKRLLGHEDISTTEGHYGAGYDERTLAEAMSRIKFPDLDLTALYPAALTRAAA